MTKCCLAWRSVVNKCKSESNANRFFTFHFCGYVAVTNRDLKIIRKMTWPKVMQLCMIMVYEMLQWKNENYSVTDFK